LGFYPGRLTLPFPFNVLGCESIPTEASTLGYFQQVAQLEQLEHLTLILTVAQSVFPSLPFTQYLKLSMQDFLQLAGFV
jgi:hypothetical protein